jgi:hypothetical protein
LVSEKTKHVGMKWHFLKDHVKHGIIRMRYRPTGQMVADMFTKPLPRPLLTRHRSVTSTVLQQYIVGHCTCTRYGFQFVLFHRMDVYSWVRRYCNNVMVLMLQYDQYLPARTDMHS